MERQEDQEKPQVERFGGILRADTSGEQCAKYILASEYDRLAAEAETFRISSDIKQANLELEQERYRYALMRIKEMDLLFARFILAMRSAVIEMDHGAGAEAAMTWIVNSLAGPGELPPDDEADAQGYFDREIAVVDKSLAEVFAFFKANRLPPGWGSARTHC
ncbi:hypothetical protein P3W55_01995 [Pseudomonas citronellolis]|uniref:Uncharacterized protein n=1 Tax=Pseudomonas citronellolis TaxID=53408 RepID=A0AAW6P275_9PSED|nr:hypothetical protein [Pseudomonas citronellolis]MDF3840476.1 hypothetical protein [Pseudomonas citronellolis]WRT82951.1 hypothetical protein VK748_00500 [Pseudomonas citronellolis]